jgi:uncharacterized RDD family membrane protein YckC
VPSTLAGQLPVGWPHRPTAADTPSLLRRLAAFVYEGVLLFGVTMAAGYIYGILTQQRHALQGKTGLQAFLFVVLAIYFSWFWSRSGQTVAMKAWHIRLVSTDGTPVQQSRALLRYLLSWLWFVPAWAAAHALHLQAMSAIGGLTLLGVLVYAGLVWLRPDRQFWHDGLCGTRLVHWQPERPTKSKSAA